MIRTKMMYISVLFTTLVVSVDCQMFTSVFKLQRLVQAEAVLTDALKQYIEMKESKGSYGVSDYVKRFFEQQSKRNLIDEYAEHPTNAYQLINRFVNKWPGVLKEIREDKESLAQQEFNIKYSKALSVSQWPQPSDFEGAKDAILRLWDAYRLNTLDLFDGNIFGVQGEILEVEDILDIVKYSHKEWKFNDVILLLRKLLLRMKSAGSKLKSMSPVLRDLASAYSKHNMNYKAIELLEPYIHFDDELSKDYSNYLLQRNISYMNFRRGPLFRNNDSPYKALCRDNVKTDKELAELKCFHRKSLIPIYRVKEEVVNVEPRISLFHDVISESRIALMKEHAKKNMTASKVRRQKESQTAFDVRVSETSWLNHCYPDSSVLTTNIRIITGLDTTPRPRLSSVENFQVVNYGLGGMYVTHPDYISSTLLEPPKPHDGWTVRGSGERVATWMYYLSNVQKGGATVFPNINARVIPVKGAAAFWYNVRRNGKSDPRTKHAGCPVLLGSKWISNEWIREIGQIFTRRCGLTTDAVDRVELF